MVQGIYDLGFIINYQEGDRALYRNPYTYRSSVGDTYHTINYGETLHSIARKYYGSSYLWYLLADTNENIDDVFNIPYGETIVIPYIST